MALPLFVLVACELELTAAAVAVGWRLTNPRATIVTGVVSGTFALAVFGLWLLWFVAPGCIVNSACAVANSAYLNLAAGATLQWAWMLAAAHGARFAKNRHPARVS